MSFHNALTIAAAGQKQAVTQHKTPTPGSDEVLIKVHALAMNPVDYYQRDRNVPPVHSFPAVLGCDVSGVVTALGKDVPADRVVKIGTRVCALASSFYQPQNSANYGGFQEYTLAQWQYVTKIPDKVTFQEGALLPLATLTALSGWTTMDIPLDAKFTAQDKQAVLLWGASSSVGTMAVQSARSMGYTVYATASTHNHEYIRALGAHRLFDYKSHDVVDQIADAVRQDGVHLHLANCIVENSLQPTLDVLKKVNAPGTSVKVIHSPILPADHPTLDGATIKFNMPSFDKAVRDQSLHRVYHEWLEPGLANGTIKPTPRILLHPQKGLEGVDGALDTLRNGVSCAKVVVEL